MRFRNDGSIQSSLTLEASRCLSGCNECIRDLLKCSYISLMDSLISSFLGPFPAISVCSQAVHVSIDITNQAPNIQLMRVGLRQASKNDWLGQMNHEHFELSAMVA